MGNAINNRNNNNCLCLSPDSPRILLIAEILIRNLHFLVLIARRNLNNNQINRLDRRSFETLVQLNELKLNQNRVHMIPTGLFTNLKKLKKL